MSFCSEVGYFDLLVHSEYESMYGAYGLSVFKIIVENGLADSPKAKPDFADRSCPQGVADAGVGIGMGWGGTDTFDWKRTNILQVFKFFQLS